MRTCDIQVGDKIAKGFEIDLPDAPLVLIAGKKGFLMCGYLNLETCNKLGQAAGIVKGVKTVEDLLSGNVSEVSAQAQKIGVKAGVKGMTALKKLI